MSSRAMSAHEGAGSEPRDRSPHSIQPKFSTCVLDPPISPESEHENSAGSYDHGRNQSSVPLTRRMVSESPCGSTHAQAFLRYDRTNYTRRSYGVDDCFSNLRPNLFSPYSRVSPVSPVSERFEAEGLPRTGDLMSARLSASCSMDDMKRSINLLFCELAGLKQIVRERLYHQDVDPSEGLHSRHEGSKSFNSGRSERTRSSACRETCERLRLDGPINAESHYDAGGCYVPLSKAASDDYQHSIGVAGHTGHISYKESTSGVGVYPLPEQPSAIGVICIWENGTTTIPPVRSWTVEEMKSQGDKLLLWYRIYRTFTDKFDSDLRRFSSHFPEELPFDHPVFANSTFDEDFKQILDRHQSHGSPFEHRLNGIASPKNEGAWSSVSSAYQGVRTQQDMLRPDPCFVLPRKIRGRKVTAKDVIQLWDYGLGDIPPIRCWTPGQKLRQQSKISRWKKVVDIFHYQCGGDMKAFEEKYSSEHGQMLAVAAIIAKYEEANCDLSNITIGSNGLPTMTSGRQLNGCLTQKEQYVEDGSNDCSERNSVLDQRPNSTDCDPVESSESSEDFEVLYNNSIGKIMEPISVLDAVELWEKGTEKFPPVSQWTLLERKEQQKAVDAIERVYAIFCEVFHRDQVAFTKACHDENSTLLPPRDFLEKFKIHLDRIQIHPPVAPIIVSSMTFDSSHRHLVSGTSLLLHILPRKIEGRKVNARDVLTLWNHGINNIPPIKNWTPRQKAKQQSKISRWKKVVDIIEQDFRGDVEKFEKHFSTPLGELLPISAIISRYDSDRFLYSNRGGIT